MCWLPELTGPRPIRCFPVDAHLLSLLVCMMIEIPMLQTPGVKEFLTSFYLPLWIVVPAEGKLFF